MVAPTIWPLLPHTAAKHAILTRYLGAWFPKLAHAGHARLVFYDGFAGPGIYKDGEPGSPVHALQTLLDHSHFARFTGTEFVFVFNESDPARFASLEQVIKDLETSRGGWPSNVRVPLEQATFQTTTDDILTSLGGKDLAPTFAFVDPFGVNVPMDLLSKLLSYKRCELFVFFSQNFTTRFATAGNVETTLKALFGSDAYLQAPAKGPARAQYLLDLYLEQLRGQCGLRYVLPFELETMDGLHYQLCYGTKSIAGLRAMKEAMWKIDPSGEFRFSDQLDGLEVLFGDELDTRPLQAVLLHRFGGQTVEFAAIDEYVLAETPFHTSHIKTRTLKPLEAAGRLSAVLPGRSRKTGTYPDGTRITFI